MKEINFDNILGTIYGTPVVESKYTPQDTVIIINKKTGVGKIIAYEERIEQLYKENSTLKKQLSEIKYIGYKEVKKMLLNHILTKEEPDEITISFRSKVDGKKYGIITSIYDLAVRICSLALPTRERIIDILKRWQVISNATESVLQDYWDCEDDITSEDKLNKIATEILGEEREDE